MVMPGKIFKLTRPVGFRTLVRTLKGYRMTERLSIEDKEFELVTEITDLEEDERSVSGIYAKDSVTFIYYHGKYIPTPKTTETYFNFTARKNDVLLVVLQEKWTAKRIASELSRIIFGAKGYITETEIAPEDLKAFHDQNPRGTKVSFFERVAQNIDKLSLYGPDLIEASLFEDYSSKANLWYIVATSRKYGHVVGITRNGIVVIFNKVTPKEYIEFVVNEVFPIIM